jgi:hypothetical protein
VNEHQRPAPLSTEEKNAIVQKPKNYGKVPAYIDKFNKEREDERVRRQLAEEQAKLPPGTRLMPEDERVKTLEDLLQAKKQCNNELEKLPVVVKSIRMQQHKQALEEKMFKLDRAIDTFSKAKVYVQL